jgi:sugar-specific transcriptional regulator TrmB
MILDEESAIETLKILGLTEYEAKSYIALNSIGVAKVTDIHNASGVPRSAIYGTLTKLEEKGLIEVEYGKPMRYKSIEPFKAIKKLINFINTNSEDLIDFLDKYKAKKELGQPSESVWTLRSVKNLMVKLNEMVSSADNEIVFVAYNPLFSDSREPFPIIKNLMPVILEKIHEGIKIRVICMDQDQIPILKQYFHGVEVKFPDSTKHSSKIPLKGDVLMVDNSEVLINVIDGEKVLNGYDSVAISAVYTSMDNMVSVFRHLIEVEWDYALS